MHLGNNKHGAGVVTQAPLKAMIATFDRDDKVPAEGEAIAPGWHLCFLHSYARRNVLAADGLPTEGGVLACAYSLLLGVFYKTLRWERIDSPPPVRGIDGKVHAAQMEAASELTDFSFDFHDLRLAPVE